MIKIKEIKEKIRLHFGRTFQEKEFELFSYAYDRAKKEASEHLTQTSLTEDRIVDAEINLDANIQNLPFFHLLLKSELKINAPQSRKEKSIAILTHYLDNIFRANIHERNPLGLFVEYDYSTAKRVRSVSREAILKDLSAMILEIEVYRKGQSSASQIEAPIKKMTALTAKKKTRDKEVKSFEDYLKMDDQLRNSFFTALKDNKAIDVENKFLLSPTHLLMLMMKLKKMKLLAPVDSRPLFHKSMKDFFKISFGLSYTHKIFAKYPDGFGQSDEAKMKEFDYLNILI